MTVPLQESRDIAIAMVREAAASLQEIYYVGWDAAFIPGDVCLVLPFTAICE